MIGSLKDEMQLRRHIKTTPIDGSPCNMRDSFMKLAGPQTMTDVEVIERGGVRCMAIGSGPELLWFHGGGYVFGSAITHLNLARKLASFGLRIILPEYRLAPEHIWPAQLQDAIAVVDATAQPENPVNVGGDSAGGHLALCVAQRRALRRLALISPNTDRTGLSTTRHRCEDLMNTDASDSALFRTAMPDMQKDDPDASPIFSNLSRLPPIHLEVAGDEILLDDSMLLSRRAILAGVEVSLHATPGLFHMFTLWPDTLVEGAKALERSADFILRE